MKTTLRLTFATLVVLLISALVLWLKFRHPYEANYFTPEMHAKYTTVESVLDAMGDRNQVNEAYGFNVTARYGTGSPSSNASGKVRSIRYSKDNKLAIVETSKSGWFLIWRSGRWVFYPETPWLPMLEIIHPMG